ncbi:LON peptidase substrate-binding domain-containing protein [Halocola ammonii]
MFRLVLNMNTDLENLPLFPLSLFLLPGEQTHLHIFEPRYRELVQRVKSSDDQLFGIPYFVKHNHKLGSLVKLVDVVKEYPSGEKDILVEGVAIFELKGYNRKSQDRPFPSGKVKIRDHYKTWMADRCVKREFTKLKKAFDQPIVSDSEDLKIPILTVLAFLNLSSSDKYNFLSGNDFPRQEEQLLNMIKFTRLIAQQERRKEFNFYMN